MLLVESKHEDLPSLMTWFKDESTTCQWGGPLFRYPFSDTSFYEDLKLEIYSSYTLWSDKREKIGFGQVYERLGRGHLARLAIAPGKRGNGLGLFLVNGLCEKASEVFQCPDHSLFVFRRNNAAIACYARAGFRESAYPEDYADSDNIMYMVRADV